MRRRAKPLIGYRVSYVIVVSSAWENVLVVKHWRKVLSCLARGALAIQQASCRRVLAHSQLEDLVCCYAVRPFDAHNLSQVAHVESVEPSFLTRVL